MNYYKKYIKYKNKYIKFKKQIGGSKGPIKIVADMGKTFNTLGECIKELIKGAYQIYIDILALKKETTIICGGQSPAYYCLAMLHFKIYDSNNVDIIILPHSKGGELGDVPTENKQYCARLKEKNITLKKNVIIIDGVHSGVGINSLAAALKHCYDDIIVSKYAINTMAGISKIDVDKEYYFECEPIFSDRFPRLITAYYPRDFNDSTKFKNEFNLNKNPIAEMIIDIATNYPVIKVEDTKWFKLNNDITPELEKKREEAELELEKKREEAILELEKKREEWEEAGLEARLELEKKREEWEDARLELEKKREEWEEEKEEKEEREKIEELTFKIETKGQTFKPIVSFNESKQKIYECPECHKVSGTLLIIPHRFDCNNRHMKPQE